MSARTTLPDKKFVNKFVKYVNLYLTKKLKQRIIY
jgi:hypothetical protein